MEKYEIVPGSIKQGGMLTSFAEWRDPPEPKILQHADIAFKDGFLYCVSSSKTLTGRWFPCRPILTIPASRDSARIGRTVLDELQFSRWNTPEEEISSETTLDVYGSFIKAFGLAAADYKALYRKLFDLAIILSISRVDDVFKVYPMQVVRGGIMTGYGLEFHQTCKPEPEEVAKAIFRAIESVSDPDNEARMLVDKIKEQERELSRSCVPDKDSEIAFPKEDSDAKKWMPMLDQLERLGYYSFAKPARVKKLKHRAVRYGSPYDPETWRMYGFDPGSAEAADIKSLLVGLGPFLRRALGRYPDIRTSLGEEGLAGIEVNGNVIPIPTNADGGSEQNHPAIHVLRSLNKLLKKCKSEDQCYLIHDGEALIFLTPEMRKVIQKCDFISDLPRLP